MNTDIFSFTPARRFGVRAIGQLLTKLSRHVTQVLALLFFAGASVASFANPQSGEITLGTGTIDTSQANLTTINQQSDRLRIDWQSFDVAVNERVVFQQPSTNSVALNRIWDQNASQIFGAIDANGRILLVNPNGIVFGEGARVNLQSLVATSLDLSLEDFRQGNYDLQALAESSGAAIINRGQITAANGGSVSLIGDSVLNEGVIVAEYGQVNLAAGRQAAVDFEGDGLLMFAVGAPRDDATTSLSTTNTGQVLANGGQVFMGANAARDVVSSVVNNEGTIRATRIDNSGGVIRLVGGSSESSVAINSGVLDASSETSNGGTIEVTGSRVGVLGNAQIDASGVANGGAVRIGGGFQGNDASLDNSNYTYVGANTQIAADSHIRGDGGEVIVWSDRVAVVHGDISVQGGAISGDGGFVETSGKEHLTVISAPDISARAGNGGEWLLDPFNILIAPGGDETAINDDVTPNEFVSTDPDPAPTSILGVDVIDTALDAGDVTIITGGGPLEGGDGDITWDPLAVLDYDTTGSNTLTLDAANNILLNGDILDGDTGSADALSLTLIAGGNVIQGADSTLALGAGVIDVTTAVDVTLDGIINAGGLSITSSGDVALGATSNVDLGAGQFDVVSAVTFTNAATISATAESTINATGLFANSGVIGTVTGNLVVNTGGDVDNTGSLNASEASVSINFGQSGAATADLGTLGGISNFVTGGAQGDRITITDTGLQNTDIIGGDGLDTLFGANTANNWDVIGSDTGTLNLSNTFSAIENVIGGSAADTFTLNGVITGSIDGAAGDDTVVGPNTVNDWLVDEANGGSLNAGSPTAVAFSNIENLTGGTDIDDFLVVTGGSLTGEINGGAGAGLNALERTSDTDAVWNVTADGAGTVTDVGGFLNINELTGGDAQDAFTLGGVITDGIDGAGGATDSLTGADAINNWVLNQVGGSLNLVTFDNIESVTGGGAADTFTLAALFSGAVDGAGGDDTIEGPDTLNNWLVDQANGGTLNAGTPTEVAFSNIENLTGGTDIDDFTVSTGSLSGAMDGGAGVNSLTRTSAGDAQWNVTAIGGGTVTGVGSFSNMSALIGGAAADTFTLNGVIPGGINGAGGVDTVVGPSTANDWLVDQANGGSLNSGTLTAVTFSNVENLTGGTNTDDFLVITGGSLTGDIDGGTGAGLNTLERTSAADAVWNVTADGAGTVTDVGGFLNINELTGGDAQDAFTLGGVITDGIDGAGGVTDSLTGADAINDWVLNAVGGTLNLVTFDNIESVIGGGAADTFTLAALFSGAVDGAGGDDTIEGPDTANDWLVNQANGGSLNAGTPTAVAFSNIENLTGGNQDDLFAFAAGGSVVALLGGDGNDTLQGQAANTVYELDSAAGGTYTGVVADFDEIEVVRADAATDSTFNINGVFAGTLIGSDGALGDDFNFVGAGGLAATGQIQGGVGLDVVTGSDTQTNTWALTGADSGSVNGGDFTGIEALVGGNDVDIFEASGAFVGDVQGGLGDDIYRLLAGGTFGGFVDGEAGNDTLESLVTNNLWDINNLNEGTLEQEGVGVTSFIDIENLLGGDDFDDVFSFNYNGLQVGSLTGSVDGGLGLGRNTLVNDAPATEGPLTWVFTGTGTGTLTPVVANFVNIDDILAGANVDAFEFAGGSIESIDGGNAGGVNSIAGNNAPNAWSIDGLNEGLLVSGGNGTVFTNIDSVIGGSDTDEFTFEALGALTGTLEGGAGGGLNTLFAPDSLAQTNWTLNAAGAGTVGFVAGGFTQINAVFGGTGVNVFTINGEFGGDITGNAADDQFLINSALVGGSIDGDDGEDSIVSQFGGDNSWVVDGLNSGTLNDEVFENVENLTGGAGADDYVVDVAGSWEGLLDGLGGVNSLTGPNQDETWFFNSATGGFLVATGAFLPGNEFSNINDVIGGSGADTFDIFTVFTGSVSGNDGNDIFNFDFGDVGGQVTGNAGDDTFNFINGVVTAVISAGNDNDTFDLSLGGSFTGTPDGEGGTDLLIAGSTGPENFWTIDGNNGDLNGAAYNNIESLTGGDVDDFFLIINNGFGGVIDGGGGNNELAGNDAGADWIINALDGGSLVNSGSVDDLRLFTNIQSIVGGIGNDNYTLVTGGSIIALNDDGGTDVLTGSDTFSTWNLNASQGGTVDAITDPFSGIDNVVGGDGGNSFVLTNLFAGNVTGGTGADEFILAGNALNISGVLDGGGGVDTLMGPNDANLWLIEGTNFGSLNGKNFVAIENLTGNALVDLFVLGTPLNVGNISGVIDGGGPENDVLIGNPTLNNEWLITGNDAGTLNGDEFINIGSLTGGDLSDDFTLTGGTLSGDVDGGLGFNSLTAGAGPNDWTLNGLNEGTVTGIANAFVQITNVIGGSGVDVFVVDDVLGFAGTVNGAGGDDIFDMVTGAITGLINGGEGTDTLNGTVDVDDEFVVTTLNGGMLNGNSFVEIENLAGVGGTNSFTLVDGTVAQIDGGSGSDTLFGDNVANDWLVNAPNSGLLNLIVFNNVENLTGGGVIDSFVFSAVLDGTAMGGAGEDRFTLAGGAPEIIVGGADFDTFVGNNADSTWQVTAAAAGVQFETALPADQVMFSEIENLTGGTMADVITVNAGASMDVIDGGGGDDMITIAGTAGNVFGSDGADVLTEVAGGTVALLDGGIGNDRLVIGSNVSTAELVGGENDDVLDYSTVLLGSGEQLIVDLALDQFAAFDIESIIGNGADSTLASGAGNDEWQLDELGNGTLVRPQGSDSFISFTAFETLDAGSTLGEINTLIGPDIDLTWTVGADNDLTVELTTDMGVEQFSVLNVVSGIDQFRGGSEQDTFNIEFVFEGTIGGGLGDDVFNLIGTGGVLGTLSGDEGNDTLNGADAATDWTVTGLNEGTVTGITDGFTAIENLAGGSGIDTFNVAAMLEGNLSGGAGADVITLSGDPLANVGGMILGGADNDTLTVSIGDFARSIVFDGGAGTDTLNLSGGAAGFTGIVDAATSTVTYTSGAAMTQDVAHQNVESAADTVLADSLLVNAPSTTNLMLTGGAATGENTLTFDGGLAYGVSNKTDLDVSAAMAAMMLVGDVGVDGLLSLEAGTLTSDGGTITATQLDIVGATILSALNTSVDTLALLGVSGVFEISDLDDVELLNSMMTGIGSDATISAANSVTVSDGTSVSSEGDITLESAMTTVAGQVSGADVALQGGAATVSGELTGSGMVSSGLTGDLNLGGSINGADVALSATNLALDGSVAGTNTVDVNATGNITQSMDGAVTAGGDVSLAAAMTSIQGNVSGNNVNVMGGTANIEGSVAGISAVTSNLTGDLNLRDGGNINALNVALVGANLTLDGAVGGTNSVGLTSSSAVAQGANGSISTTNLNVNAMSGVSLAGTNTAANVIAQNALGNMQIENTGTASAMLTNSGGTLQYNQTGGNLTLLGVQNTGGNTQLASTGSLTVANDIAVTGGTTLLMAGTAVTQNADLSSSDSVMIAANSIEMALGVSTTSTDGDLTIDADNNIALNDLIATNGVITIDSANGDITAVDTVVDLSGIDFNLIGFKLIGTTDNQFNAINTGSGAATLSLSTPDGSFSNAQSVVSRTGEFNDTIGSRSGNAIDPRGSQTARQFSQGLSATLDAEGSFDFSSLAAKPSDIIGPVGRGVLVPCSQAADEEETCQ